jgi:hypothetical protein
VRDVQLDVMLGLRVALERADLDFGDHEVSGDSVGVEILSGGPILAYASGTLLPDARLELVSERTRPT